MEIRHIMHTARSVTIEIADGGRYFTKQPIELRLNGEPTLTTEKTITSLFDLKPDQKYVIGDIVIYDNKTWRFKVDHEPGEWDESQVERTNILAVIAEQNKNFGNLTFAQDADGNWGYKVGGADPVIPFKQGGVKLLTSITGDGAINITSYVTTDYKKLTVDNFIVESYYFPKAQTVNTSGGNRSAGAALGATLSKSYDQSTGILTVSGLSQLACLMDNTTNVRASVIQKFSAKIYMVN